MRVAGLVPEEDEVCKCRECVDRVREPALEAERAELGRVVVEEYDGFSLFHRLVLDRVDPAETQVIGWEGDKMAEVTGRRV